MKRFLIVFGWIALCGISSAATIDQVVRVNSYQYIPLTDTYQLTSYGSGVIVDDTTILTNAHVILNDLDDPYRAYEICLNRESTRKPDCVYSAGVVKYDQEEDLALLRLVEGKLSHHATFSTIEPSIDDDIRVVGYAANGGESITVTRGIISGKENGLYKFDANVDHGNSGGGMFNDRGEFIGIPTQAYTGLTTLGYMVPVSTIKDFLVWVGTSSPSAVDSNFVASKRNSHLQLKNNAVKHPDFSFLGFEKYGFYFSEASELQEFWLYEYDFVSNDKKTEISITPTVDADEDRMEAWENFFNSLCTYYKKSSSALGEIAYCLYGDSGTDFILTISWQWVDYTVTTDISKPAGLKNALRAYLKIFKGAGSDAIELPEKLEIGNLTIEGDENLFIVPSTHDEDTSNIELYGIEKKSWAVLDAKVIAQVVDDEGIEAPGQISEYDYAIEFGNYMYDYLSTSWYTDLLYAFALFRNKQNHIGLYINLYDQDSGEDNLSYQFFHLKENIISILTVSVTNFDAESWNDADIAKYIDSIKLSGSDFSQDTGADVYDTPSYDSF